MIKYGIIAAMKEEKQEIENIMTNQEYGAGLTKTFQTWPRGWFHIP